MVDFVTFYVQVPDAEAALAAVEKLGGATIMEPVQAGSVVLAHFRDPRGNRIGLVRAEPA
jgi:predicted enzyme related to lactoylglutathione lyase